MRGELLEARTRGLPAAVQLQAEPIPGELHPNLEPADNNIGSFMKKNLGIIDTIKNNRGNPKGFPLLLDTIMMTAS